MRSAIDLKISDHNILIDQSSGIASFNIAGAPYRGISQTSKTTNNGFNLDETTNPTAHTTRLSAISQHIGQNITTNNLGIILLQEVPKNGDATYDHFAKELNNNLPKGWVVDLAMHSWTTGENFANHIMYDGSRLKPIQTPKYFYSDPAMSQYLQNTLGQQYGRAQFAAFQDLQNGQTIVVCNAHAKWLSHGECISKQGIISTAQSLAAQTFKGAKLLIGGDFNVQNKSLSANPNTEVAFTYGAGNVSYDSKTGGQNKQTVDLIIHSQGLDLRSMQQIAQVLQPASNPFAAPQQQNYYQQPAQSSTSWQAQVIAAQPQNPQVRNVTSYTNSASVVLNRVYYNTPADAKTASNLLFNVGVRAQNGSSGKKVDSDNSGSYVTLNQNELATAKQAGIVSAQQQGRY